jgi:hypothetical protein
VSARVDARLEDDLIAEAVRSDRTPSALIADLLDEALAARRAAREGTPAQPQTVTVNIAELHRAIDQVARRAA